MDININIFNDTVKRHLPQKRIKEVVNNTLINEKIKKANVNVILVENDYIQDLNRKFLGHDYPTDVISFNFDEQELAGEIYISIDTALIQADEYKVSLTKELLRLAVHGALHLIGYNDDTEAKRMEMTHLENKYII